MKPYERMEIESEMREKSRKQIEKIRKEHNTEIEKFRSLLKEIQKNPSDQQILGKIEEALLVECETCGGRGEACFSCCTGELVTDDIQMCPKCHEHLGESECEDCGGTGKVPEDKKDFIDHAPSLQRAAEAYEDAKKYGEI